MAELITLTQEQLLQAHNQVTIPALILLFIIMSFIFLIVGMLIVKRDKKNLWKIWLISNLFASPFLLMLIFMPVLTQDIINFFRSLM